MTRIGRYNKLTITRKLDFGLIADGGEPFGEILIPGRYVQADWKIGDEVNVFVYTDSEDRLVATTEQPLIQAGGFAVLRVKQMTPVGAFLECGLLKDLLVPYREQHHRLQEGEKVVAYAFVDPQTQRMVASTKIEEHLRTEGSDIYRPKDSVQIIVYQRTDLGFKVIVDQQYKGMLYADEVFSDLHYGDKMRAFVDQVRPDGKLDIVLYKTGYNKVVDFSAYLLEYIRSNHGFVPYTDRTDPDVIYKVFGVSKKTFKKAVGDLYKKQWIDLTEDGLKLIKKKTNFGSK